MSVECALCTPTLSSRFQKGVSICTGAGVYGGSENYGFWLWIILRRVILGGTKLGP